MDFLSGLEINHSWQFNTILINILIALVLLIAFRFLSGLVANVKTSEELAQKDNFAFGMSFAGGVIALAIMMTGAISGEANFDLGYGHEVGLVFAYGFVGLLLIKLGRFIQDKLVLSGVAIMSEIKKGNLAIAFVDVANGLATALVLRAVMNWVDLDSWDGLIVVLLAFLPSQLLLALITFYRLFVYRSRHDGGSLQSAWIDGNVALSIRYFGHLLGAGLAITAASGLVAFSVDAYLLPLLTWFLVGVVLAVSLSLLAIILRRVLLASIDVVQEVDREQNIAVAAIEAAIYLAVGLLLAASLSG